MQARNDDGEGASGIAPFVLYVGDGDRGSADALAAAAPLGDAVLPQRVAELDQAGLPAWLNGTPILVRTGDGVAFRGSYAVQALREEVEAARAAKPPPAPEAPGGAAASRVAGRGQHLWSEDPALGDTEQGAGLWPEAAADDSGDPDVPRSSDRQLRMFDDGGGGSGKVSESSLREYMSMRDPGSAPQQPP